MSNPPPPYYPPPARSQPEAPDGRLLADPGQRFAARIVDDIVFFLVAALLAGIFGGGAAAAVSVIVGEDSPALPAAVISVIVVVVLGTLYVYEVEVPLRWNGQTPGKRALKIAVIAIEPYGVLGRGRLASRFGVMFAFNLLSNCWIGLVDPLWCLWDKPYRQCLHDKPARTVVVRVSDRTGPVDPATAGGPAGAY